MRTLIAGLGNVFEGDDGFGVAVAAALTDVSLPPGAEVHDFGIRGVHLAYQLLEGYDLVVIADAVQRDGPPGTVYVIDHAADADRPEPAADAPILDAHDLGPDGVLALVPMLGGTLGRVVVVGCEPATLAPDMGLSRQVARSVGRAAELVTDLVRDAHEVAAAAAADGIRIGGGGQ
ncbi:MAG: hydrogenase maturation protease [Jatrophihabitantaceae bacterium]